MAQPNSAPLAQSGQSAPVQPQSHVPLACGPVHCPCALPTCALPTCVARVYCLGEACARGLGVACARSQGAACARCLCTQPGRSQPDHGIAPMITNRCVQAINAPCPKSVSATCTVPSVLRPCCWPSEPTSESHMWRLPCLIYLRVLSWV